jgi:hypothetical protein
MDGKRILWLACALVALGVLPGAGPDSTDYALTPPPRMRLPEKGVLFHDDFSSGDLGTWTPDRAGVWSVRHGSLRATLPDQKQQRSLLMVGDSTWTDIAVDLDVCMVRGVDKGVVMRVRESAGVGVDLRGGTYQDCIMYFREWPLGRASAMNANGVWHHLRVEARGARYRVWVNGESVLDRTQPQVAGMSGRIALPAYTGGAGACTVFYDNVVVTSLDAALSDGRAADADR